MSCWEYCFTQTNNHKRFKILKIIYIFRHCRFNKRYLFTCYESLCSDNLLTQSCLLIPVFHTLFVRYSQACVLKTSFPHLVFHTCQVFATVFLNFIFMKQNGLPELFVENKYFWILKKINRGNLPYKIVL